MPTLDICPYELDICITRGDSTPMSFQMQDSAGANIDIAGRAYLMSVNAEENPAAPTTNAFQLTGVLGTPTTDGIVIFTPLVAETDLEPGEFFFDIQETNGAALRTVVKGKFTVEQDITK